MQPKSARTLRGLSIAIIIISILAIIGSLVMFATAGLLTYAVTDPDAAASVSMSVEASPEASAQLDELGMTAEDGLMLTGFFGLLGVAGAILCIVCYLITLVAGIMGTKGAKNLEKVGTAKVWMIIGAIFAAITCLSMSPTGVVLAVLCIIAAVYANKAKSESAGNFVPYGDAR